MYLFYLYNQLVSRTSEILQGMHARIYIHIWNSQQSYVTTLPSSDIMSATQRKCTGVMQKHPIPITNTKNSTNYLIEFLILVVLLSNLLFLFLICIWIFLILVFILTYVLELSLLLFFLIFLLVTIDFLFFFRFIIGDFFLTFLLNCLKIHSAGRKTASDLESWVRRKWVLYLTVKAPDPRL